MKMKYTYREVIDFWQKHPFPDENEQTRNKTVQWTEGVKELHAEY